MPRLRSYLLLVVLLGGGLARPTAAQVSVDGGVLFGANVATLHGTVAADRLGYRTAASGGVFGQINVANPLAVRGELLFSPKGVKVETDRGELTLKANYMELPILLVGRLPFARAYNPHLMAGPALGLKLYERRGAPGLSFRTDETVFARTDAGIMVGAGASIGRLGAPEIEVRYTYGMTEVTRTVTTAPLDEALPPGGKNGVVSVLVRFSLNF